MLSIYYIGKSGAKYSHMALRLGSKYYRLQKATFHPKVQFVYNLVQINLDKGATMNSRCFLTPNFTIDQIKKFEHKNIKYAAHSYPNTYVFGELFQNCYVLNSTGLDNNVKLTLNQVKSLATKIKLENVTMK